MVNEKKNFYIKFNHVNIIPIIMEFISFLNPITQEKMTIIMNEYDLQIEEEGSNHHIYDMISSLFLKIFI